MLNTILRIVVPAIVSLLAVNWVYFKILRVAKDKGIVDNPNARKLQIQPVPVLGGIAVFFGIVTGVLVGASVFWAHEGTPLFCLAPVLCASMIMIYVGALDDTMGLSPASRFAIEILTVLGLICAGGGCIDSFHGMWGVDQFSWWIAIPLTIFAGVGIINAINMIDGVNGLSSGLCIACSAVFGSVFLKVDDMPNAILAFTMVASLLPFLLHNVFGKSSRMFIGDAGTMMMGVIMVWFTICLLRSDSTTRLLAIQKNSNMIAMALAILCVPIFDTVRVMTQRVCHGKSPFHPDKTHLHHIFIQMGVSHSITAITEILIDLLIVGIWSLTVKSGWHLDVQLYIVIIAAIILVWGTYYFLLYQEKNHTAFMHDLARFSIRTHLGHKNWWLKLQKWLDAPEFREHAKVTEEVKTHSTDPYEFYHLDQIDPSNFKELDRKKLFDFLKGKVEVYVDDIKKRSGVDPYRVDSLISESLQDGFIRIVDETSLGTPIIVTLED